MRHCAGHVFPSLPELETKTDLSDNRVRRRMPELLAAGALAVLASRPAAGSALAFFELLAGSPDAALSGGLLLGILYQQMNSLRASGVMSFQASSAVALAISAIRRSAGSLCTTPPGSLWPLTGPS